jgi:hypothetical protein
MSGFDGNWALIRIVKTSWASDEFHLGDRDGIWEFHFDEEAVSWDHEGWANAMAESWIFPVLNDDSVQSGQRFG